MTRRNLHRDPAGVRQGAPAPNPSEVAAALEALTQTRRINWKTVVRRALRVGIGGEFRCLSERLKVQGVDSDRVLLVDSAGYPFTLPRPESRRRKAQPVELINPVALARERRRRARASGPAGQPSQRGRRRRAQT